MTIQKIRHKATHDTFAEDGRRVLVDEYEEMQGPGVPPTRILKTTAGFAVEAVSDECFVVPELALKLRLSCTDRSN